MTLGNRAEQLLEDGLTPLRAFRALRLEFPNAEWFDLWVAVGEGPTGVTPMWAMNGSAPSEARYRNDPRPDESPTTGKEV